jgi:hypothetical protein
MKYKYTFKDEHGNVFDTFSVNNKLSESTVDSILRYWDREKNTLTLWELEVIELVEIVSYGKILDDMIDKIKMNGVLSNA